MGSESRCQKSKRRSRMERNPSVFPRGTWIRWWLQRFHLLGRDRSILIVWQQPFPFSECNSEFRGHQWLKNQRQTESTESRQTAFLWWPSCGDCETTLTPGLADWDFPRWIPKVLDEAPYLIGKSMGSSNFSLKPIQSMHDTWDFMGFFMGFHGISWDPIQDERSMKGVWRLSGKRRLFQTAPVLMKLGRFLLIKSQETHEFRGCIKSYHWRIGEWRAPNTDIYLLSMVDLPLWKIWVRQLGLLFPIYLWFMQGSE